MRWYNCTTELRLDLDLLSSITFGVKLIWRAAYSTAEVGGGETSHPSSTTWHSCVGSDLTFNYIRLSLLLDALKYELCPTFRSDGNLKSWIILLFRSRTKGRGGGRDFDYAPAESCSLLITCHKYSSVGRQDDECRRSGVLSFV